MGVLGRDYACRSDFTKTQRCVGETIRTAKRFGVTVLVRPVTQRSKVFEGLCLYDRLCIGLPCFWKKRILKDFKAKVWMKIQNRVRDPTFWGSCLHEGKQNSNGFSGAKRFRKGTGAMLIEIPNRKQILTGRSKILWPRDHSSSLIVTGPISFCLVRTTASCIVL